MGTVHVDTPVLDAMAKAVVDFDSGPAIPYVAVTSQTYDKVLDEVAAMADALLKAGSKVPMTERHLFAYEIHVADDLPEGVDWEWRAS